MKKLFTKGRIALLVIFSVLIIDQIIKVWIKTHMYWHESIRVTDWFYIYFTENNGMAFGRVQNRLYRLCGSYSDRCFGEHHR